MSAHPGSAEPVPAAPRAADRLVEHLQARGIDRVFGIPGGAISPVFDALRGTDIEIVVCQHEGMAAYMAYGYAKATGNPGVLVLTAGPGVLNALPGIAAAYLDEVPLVVLAGDVRTDFAGRGTIQDGGDTGLDIAAMMRSVTRFRDRLDQPDRVLTLLEQAFEASLQHPRGPALLQLPVDRACTPVPSVPEWRVQERHVELDIEALGEVATLLASAKRPLIMLGVGAQRAKVGTLINRIAARGRIPVVCDLEAKGLIPESNPLNLGLVGVGAAESASRYLAEGVDVLVTIGARLDDTSTGGFGPRLQPSEALVQVDHDMARIGRAFTPDVAVVGDLVEMLTFLDEMVRAPDVRTLLARDAAVRSSRPPVEVVLPALDQAPFDPRSTIVALQELFGEDAVFTSDIGNHLLFAASHLRCERPDGFHVSQGLGGMGSGIGSAMGLALHHGASRPVVGVCGDGGLLMVGNELATCAKHGIPVVLAVLDNQELGMVRHGMQALYGHPGTCDVPNVDIVQYAQSLGAHVVAVRDAGDLRRIKRAPPNMPVVVHIPIQREVRASNPREESFASEGARRHA